MNENFEDKNEEPVIKEIIDLWFPDNTEEYINMLTDKFNNPERKKHKKWEIWPVVDAITTKGYFNSKCQGILEDEEKQNW